MTTDYSKLTDDELRLEIAKAKGIEVVHHFNNQEHYYVNGMNGTGGVYYSILPKWPTDIAAAWELIEEIKNEYEVYISLGSDWVHVNVIQDNVNEDIDHEITTIAEGISPSASRAICLAYLQWVESRGKI